jgi:hypothetical protein
VHHGTGNRGDFDQNGYYRHVSSWVPKNAANAPKPSANVRTNQPEHVDHLVPHPLSGMRDNDGHDSPTAVMSPGHQWGHGLSSGLTCSCAFQVLTHQRLPEPSLHPHEPLLLTGLVFCAGLTCNPH